MRGCGRPQPCNHHTPLFEGRGITGDPHSVQPRPSQTRTMVHRQKVKSRGLGDQSVSETPVKRERPEPRPAAWDSLLYSRLERVEGLTSKISLLALGDVFSLNTLMATGIFTFSPSGIQMPWAERGGCEQEEDTPDAICSHPEGSYLCSECPPHPGANPMI